MLPSKGSLDSLETGSDSSVSVDATGMTTLSGELVPYSLSYDDSAWVLAKSAAGSASEYDFHNTQGSVYGQIIAEELELNMETLEQTVLSNAQAADPNATITNRTEKTVNGKDILVLEMTATIQGLNFVYYGYYYTGEEGTLQVMTWTTDNVAEKYRADAEALLNTLKIGA